MMHGAEPNNAIQADNGTLSIYETSNQPQLISTLHRAIYLPQVDFTSIDAARAKDVPTIFRPTDAAC